MDFLENIGGLLTDSALELWDSVVELLPSLLLALIVLWLGMAVAEAFGKLLSRALSKVYLDQAAERTGLQKLCAMVGIRVPVSRILGVLVTWFLYAVVLIASAEILNLNQVSEFLRSVVLYIPNVIVAAVILIIGIIISNFVQTLVKETSLNAGFTSAVMLGGLARWALLMFTFMAALVQLRVATELIQILFTGLVLMVSLAGGIAFGLGGKEKAREIIEQLGKK